MAPFGWSKFKHSFQRSVNLNKEGWLSGCAISASLFLSYSFFLSDHIHPNQQGDCTHRVCPVWGPVRGYQAVEL